MKLTAAPHTDSQGVHHPPIWDLLDEKGLIVGTIYTGRTVAEWIVRKCNEPECSSRAAAAPLEGEGKI